MSTAAPFGTALEIIRSITTTTVITDGATNLVTSPSGGAKSLTLPSISNMIASQNLLIFVNNAAGGGGSITVGPASGDSIIGQTVVAVGTGVTYRHDGRALNGTWYST